MSTFKQVTTHPARLMLAALAFAGAGLLAIPAQAAEADHGGGPGMGMHGGGMGAGMGSGPGMHGGGRHIERMFDGVNATVEQRAQIKTIMQAARTDLQAQRAQRQAVHEQMLAAFAQPTVDARVVESLRAQQQAQHDAASKRMLQAKLEVSRVLTPEQRKLMAERMAKQHGMMERHRAERATLAPAGK